MPSRCTELDFNIVNDIFYKKRTKGRRIIHKEKKRIASSYYASYASYASYFIFKFQVFLSKEFVAVLEM